ncbi:MAG TPA: HlyD family secretion protein [Acetobacteraceae bacterium]|nr:HlyD family secretion protein [Acetobacteraceae bacterium]
MDDLTKNMFLASGVEKFSRRRKSPARWAVLGIVLLGTVIAGLDWWLGQGVVSTDDAFTDGRAVTPAPQVAGTIVALHIQDNQRVKAGDLLLEIDPRAYAASRDQAGANLQVAQAQLDTARVQLEMARIDYPARHAAAEAQLAAARAAFAKADSDWRRQSQLPPQVITQQALDAANAARLTAQAGQASAEAELRRADMVRAQVALAESNVRELEAKLAQAKAQFEQAALNLSWTRLTAPQDGWITKRNVEVGNYVQPGQALFALVTPDAWVTANFKESDLAHLRPGQKVDISVDAYPALKLKGHVDSVQLGTGSRFTAFPPENATGNFVKTVQRVPVKIVIDSGLDPNIQLPLGLSVIPTVHTQ